MMNTLQRLKAKALLFFHEARTKVTTYVGLLIAASAEIRNQWPNITSQLPQWGWVSWLETHVYILLGFAVVYTRVRRLLNSQG